MIPWLADEPVFPPLSLALEEPNGLLAAGGGLTPEWLLAAYRRGIFPWFGPEDPILWWSPDPRMVLEPAAMKISRSLRRRLRRGDYQVRLDHDFAGVIAACAAPREPGGGTWITPSMQMAYLALHELGYAHSVECHADGQLVGGLYGIAIGRMFYGESMFARASDASKVALAHLCRLLERKGFRLIDCQMTTDHLTSLGGREMPRDAFLRRLERLVGDRDEPGRWTDEALADIDWGTQTPC
ncbi:MAG: leucyl/phenylalanyl-tRNA--protein transferase [Rhodocyclaceae bacterium]|nr:leucyl/phenylalanyl-tRNA--protein transferase [Rhodocyclaceae bacterium]